MKFSDFKVKEEAAGVGIITKQNATKDVPVGGEYMNVKKLGLGKGKPKKHPKKVRGSKTNVLFNLGMAESERLDELLPIIPAAVGTAARVATSVLPKIAKNPSHLGATGAGTAIGDKVLKQITKSRDANKGVGLKGRNLRAKQLSQKTDEVTAKDLSSESEVYVDMDGVLADFFGAWKKLVGKDWRQIKDLDGALQKIRDKEDFWLNIPVTSNAMNLLSLIKDLKGKYNILSAPLPNDPNAEPHKREWVKKNLSAFPPSKVIITSNKSVHATQPDGTPNILIDDFGKNIEKWEAAGGVGFKHKDHKFERTVKNLKQYMSEAKMSKGSIKSIHKTADKIKDKPKAKKSIGNWAKERGMDPEGAIYAIATNMKKRKQGKKITGLGKESYSRNELPQIRKKHLNNLPHSMETVNVEDIVPVQKERLKENHKKQLYKILDGRFSPIVVDCHNRIVNGHHRYDILKMLQMESITVAKLPFTLEYILQVMNEGNLIANPQRSVLVKKKNGYDWYKIGTNMANITQRGIDTAVKKDKPDIMLQFYGGEKEKKYMMRNLKRMGYDVQDADGYNDTHFDENIEGSYRLRIRENFADGKKKGKSRPGRVKRSGASCKGSVTSLRAKAKKASGERAKMYHWCANMKGGKKKSESYTKDEFLKVLSESTTQQLDEGIKDLLTKLPKNLLSKVTPIIKKIPKTAKNLTLMAVLLGTMVNAVAAGDMAKVNTPLDKLNNMTTMSSTMDTGTDVGAGHTMPDNIKVLKMPTPPEAPNSNTPDGTADDGTSTKTTKDGNRTVSSGAGTYTFSPDGKLLKYETPKIKGYSQIHDLVKKTVTVDANTSVTMTKDFGNLSKADREVLKKNDPNFDKSTTVVDQKATYDMSGKLISKDHTGIKSGGVAVGVDGDGTKSFKYDAGGKVYKADTSDMKAAKKTLGNMQKDLNIAKDKSAPFQNQTT